MTLNLICGISQVAKKGYRMLFGAVNTISAGRVGTFFSAHEEPS